jgi:hypothetical protein
MEPLTIILVPGLLGGLVIALLIVLGNRRAGRTQATMVPSRLEGVSPHMINMASIKVAGIGGFGLVAMAIAVAIGVPQIRQKIVIGLALGIVTAVIMIVRARRGGGPMPSSGQRMGANTTLSIDEPLPSHREERSSVHDAPDVRLASA